MYQFSYKFSLSIFSYSFLNQHFNQNTTVTCVIMQKNGAGLHASNSCWWDSANDNSATLKWPGEKKKDAVLQCIVCVYGVAH